MRNWIFCLLLAASSCFAAVPEDNLMRFQVVQAELAFDNAHFESVTVVKENYQKYGLEIKLTPVAAGELTQAKTILTSRGLTAGRQFEITPAETKSVSAGLRFF